MSSFRRVPFFDLRDWWFSNQRLSEIFKVDSIGFIPFFPAQQQPESQAPYGIYHFERVNGQEAWYYSADFVMVELRAFDVQDLYECMNIMVDMSNKGAVSANALSRWITSQKRPDDFEYHTIEFYKGGSIEPPSEQGGEFSMKLTFSIEYSPRQGSFIRQD